MPLLRRASEVGLKVDRVVPPRWLGFVRLGCNISSGRCNALKQQLRDRPLHAPPPPRKIRDANRKPRRARWAGIG